MPSAHRIQPSPGVPQAESLGYAGRRRIRRASRVHRPAGVRWNADTSRSGADADVSTSASAPERKSVGGARRRSFERRRAPPTHLTDPQPAKRRKEPQKPPSAKEKHYWNLKKTDRTPSLLNRPQTAAYDGRRVQMRTTLDPQCIKQPFAARLRKYHIYNNDNKQ